MSPFGIISAGAVVFTLWEADEPLGADAGLGDLDLSGSTVIGDTANKRGLGLEISNTGVAARVLWYAGVLGRPAEILEDWNSIVGVLTLTSDVGVALLISDVGVALLISDVGVALLTSDVGVALLTSDVGVALLTSDVGVALLTSDVGVVIVLISVVGVVPLLVSKVGVLLSGSVPNKGGCIRSCFISVGALLEDTVLPIEVNPAESYTGGVLDVS